MSGIAGIYNFGTDNKVDENLIRRMCSVLTHRGPDGEGIYCKGGLALGHRRLDTIDASGSHQPISNEDSSLWIICDGEIYNFTRLKEELIKKGHAFKTKSDAEVILHLYEERKEGCLESLNGIYAFAIWDERDKTLFLARDRIGLKPLHYSVIGARLIFASEIKAILQDSSIKRRIDYEALDAYLSLLYIPAPKTIFTDIKKLPAGHYLTCDKDGMKISEYWDLDFSKVASLSEGAAAESVQSRFKEAVRIRMAGDCPVGAFLSGGVDSSSVVSVMSELQDHPVITSSIGFSAKSFDELKYARLIAEKYSTDHHEYIVEPTAQLLEVLDKLSWLYDEPFGDASSIPSFYAAQMARERIKAALAGDGGDESFAGYDRFVYCNFIARFQNRLPHFAKEWAKGASHVLSGGGALAIKIRNKIQELYLSPFELYFKIISIFQEDEKRYLYSGRLKGELKGYSLKDGLNDIFKNCKSDDYISRLQYFDIKTGLPDDGLVKVDRATMANSLQVRMPFLDHTFMEYAATLPASLKIRGLEKKYIFKKAMSKNVPREILNRQKMGFGAPVPNWLKNELKGMVESELFDRDGIIRELFDLEYVRKIWSFVLYGQMRGFRKTDFSYRIWLLFIFSRWVKKYMRNG